LVLLDPRPGTVYRLSSILLLTLLLLNLNLKLNFLLVHIATDSSFVALLAGFVERRFISFLLYCIVLYPVFNNWQQLKCDDSHALLTTAVLWCHVEEDAVIIFEHIIYLKSEQLPRRCLWEALNEATDVSGTNFLLAFHSNYGSILLSFWDMNTEQTAASITYLGP